MTPRLDHTAIEQARAAAPLVAMVARRVKLRRAGRGWAGLCPFHDEKTASFTVSDERGFYHCFGCGAHGNAIDWVMETAGLGFVEAVKQLLGGHLPDASQPLPEQARRAAAERPVDIVASATAGRWIYRTSGPARGEIVEQWLISRGLAPGDCFDGRSAAIDQLRFHPRCPLGAWRVEQDPATVACAPAMVAPIGDAAGAVWGVHVTYLSADGRTKAALPRRRDGSERPTRKMFGSVSQQAVWLTPPPGAQVAALPLVIGEGIETSWSYAQALGRPVQVAAALSLENLQGGAKRIGGGALPLWKLESDPERPPFLVDAAGETIVLIDADMKPLRRQKVQERRGERPILRDVTGMERADICARLAAQAWRRAGAASVRCVRPPAGMDFNDAARAAA